MLLALLLPTTHARAQQTQTDATPLIAPFTDVPLNDPAYHALEVLENAGIVSGYFNAGTYGGKREMTRYEFAVIMARLLPALLYPASGVKYDRVLLQAHSELTLKLRQHPEAITAFHILLNEFEPYIVRMVGTDANKLAQQTKAVALAEARLNALQQPFSDIPTSHWAYQSVKTLYEAGVLQGYPLTK